MIRVCCVLSLLATIFTALPCSESLAQSDKPEPPPHLEIGKVRVYRAEGRIEISGRVAVQKNLIELFACGEGGKVHESVLVLDCRPSNLNLAMKLLGFDDGGQVKVTRHVKVEENGKIVEKEQEVLEENGPNYLGDPRKPVGDRVIVTVSWKQADGVVKVRAEDMIWERSRERSMPRAGWVYTGSRWVLNPMTKRQEFVADHSKTLMTTWHDPDSLLDNPLPDGADDEVYFANPDIVPERGTEVVVEIRRPTEEELAAAKAVEKKEDKASARRKGEGGDQGKER